MLTLQGRAKSPFFKINMANRTDSNKLKILRALKKHKGLVTTACQSAKVGRTTYYEWLEKDPEFKAKVDEIIESEIDNVESKLFNMIENEIPSAVIFYLKSKAKTRGYNSTLDVKADVSGEITVAPINIIKPDEQTD